MSERGSGRTEQLAQEEKSKLVNAETKWVSAAMERLLELLEARKRLILETNTMESIQKLKYDEWQPMAKQLQSEGFMYTTASCQKKYNNMKRSYMNTKKIVEKEKSRFVGRGEDPSTKLIRVGWSYFLRFAAFIDEPVESNIVIKPRDPNKDDDDDGEDDGEGDDESRSSKKSSRNSNSKFKAQAQVSSAVQTILKSEPVVILEDCGANDMDYTLHLVSDSILPDEGRMKEELPNDVDFDVENEAHYTQSLLRKLRRRTRETPESDASYNPSPRKRTRKPRVRYSPSRSTSPEPERRSEVPQPKQAKTFSLSSTTSDEVVTEIKRLRGDVNQINRNLEDLVSSHNQLNQNFEKFLKLMSKRFK